MTINNPLPIKNDPLPELSNNLNSAEYNLDNVGDVIHDDATASDMTIQNIDSDKDIIFSCNDGGAQTAIMTVDGSAGQLSGMTKAVAGVLTNASAGVDYVAAEADTLGTVTGRGATTTTASTFEGNLTAGKLSGTTGQVSFVGTTSGTAVVKTSDAAGTPTIVLPISSGTLALTSDIPAEADTLTSVTGRGATTSTAVELWGNATLGRNGVTGPLAGSLTINDGANPGTNETITYAKWNSLNDTSGIVKCNGSGTFSAASDGTDFISSVVVDTTPQLGGALDCQENDIDNIGNIIHNEVGVTDFTIQNIDLDKDFIFSGNDGTVQTEIMKLDVSAGQLSGLIKATTGVLGTASAGTDYYNPSGTDVAVADGGTGISAYAVGDILYASATTTISPLTAVAAGQPLLSAGVTTAPVYAGYTLSGTAVQTYTFPGASQTLSSLAGTETLSNKRIVPRITTIVSHATPTINTDNCDCVTITAQAEAITSMTTNLTGTPNNFDKLIIRILDNATARAITWGAKFVAKGQALPTTTVLSKLLTVGFIYDSVLTTWGCVASAQEV